MRKSVMIFMLTKYKNSHNYMKFDFIFLPNSITFDELRGMYGLCRILAHLKQRIAKTRLIIITE